MLFNYQFKDITSLLITHNFKLERELEHIIGNTGAIYQKLAWYDLFLINPINYFEKKWGFKLVVDNKINFGSIAPTREEVNLAIIQKDIPSGMELFIPRYRLDLGIPTTAELRIQTFKPRKNDKYFKTRIKQYQSKDKNGRTYEELELSERDALVKTIGEARLDLDKLKTKLGNLLDNQFEIKTRTKDPKSLFSRLNDGLLPTDINGMRILCNEANDCFEIAHKINEKFMHVTTIKDWVSTPKINLFQSLSLIGVYEGKNLEIQIQTKQMEQWGELGEAADYRIF